MKLRKGLSLVEIVAVFAIIAIIGLAAMARFSTVNESARIANLDTSFAALETSFMLAMANNGGQIFANSADAEAAIEPFMDLRHHSDIDELLDGFSGPHNITWGIYVDTGATENVLWVMIDGLEGVYTGRRGVQDGTSPHMNETVADTEYRIERQFR